MSNLPVFLFLFADSEGNSLAQLNEEADKIDSILRPLDDKSIKLVIHKYCTLEKASELIGTYKDNLGLFHYSGHAKEHQVELSDSPAFIGGLAKMIGVGSSLQLVFMNGCSTIGHTKYLHKNGIPVVIATSAPVNDTKAKDFSIEFYKAIAQNYSIEEAFTKALSVLESHGKLYERNLRKDLDSAKDTEGNWGIYSNHTPSLGWRLKEPLPEIQETRVEEKLANHHLIDNLYEAISKVKPDIKDEDKDEIVVRRYFPFFIQTQLDHIFNVDRNEKNSARLRQIQLSYLRIIRFLSSVLIADYWENFKKLKKKNTSTLNSISLYLKTNENGIKTFPYLQLIQSIILDFQKNSIEPYISEAKLLVTEYEKKKEFYHSWISLENLLNTSILDSEKNIESLCNQAEYYLSNFLSVLIFLIDYQLYSNKKVFARKLRSKSLLYDNELRKFKENKLKEENTYRKTDECLDQYSIYLGVKNKKNLLNLTPFVIENLETNTSIDGRAHLFMFQKKLGNQDMEYNFDNLRSVSFKDLLKLSKYEYEKISPPEKKLQLESVYQTYLELFLDFEIELKKVEKSK